MNPAITTTTTTTTITSTSTAELNDSPSFSKGELAQYIGSQLASAVNDKIAERADVPQAKRDQAAEALSSAVGSGNPDIQMSEFLQELVNDFVQDTMEDADKKASEGGGNGGGNWLVELAKAMGEVAGKHLERMVRLSNEITQVSGGEVADLDGKTGDELTAAQDSNTNIRADEAQMMASLTAEMQAEAQMFKMTQEMTTTVVKNIGEALHSTARKQ